MKQGIFNIIFSLIGFSGFAQAPVADFSTATTKVCVGTAISFKNSSVASNSPIQTSVWDFGDGNTSSVSGTNGSEHTYTTPGFYTVELLVISSSNVSGQKKKANYIEVLALPKADFEVAGDKCTLPATISISNKSSVGSGYSYKWDFGNGQTSTSSSPTPIAFSSAGTFSMTLTLSNNFPGCSGATGNITKPITIYDFRGTISGANTICAESDISLVIKPNRKVDTYAWDFGNQTVGGNNDSMSGIYKKAGNYTVTVTMTDNSIACSAKSTFKVQVKPLPTPSFSVDKIKVCPNFPVQFTNTSQEGTDFVWNFGEGSYSGKTPPPTIYPKEGDYNVSLEAKGKNGCVGQTKLTKYILVHNPHPKIAADKWKGCSMLTTQFSDSSTMSDTDNPIVKWEWELGNGKTSVGKKPPVQLYDIGKYDIKLKLTTKNNCVNDTVFKSFIKVGRIEKVQFTVQPSAECVKKPIQFLDASTILAPHTADEIIATWDFGDGSNETITNPSHAYVIDTGYFNVQLKLDFRGCIDSVLIPKVVYIKPSLASFVVQKLYCNPIMPLSVKFMDNSKSRVSNDVSVNWSFGDGKTGVVAKVDMQNPALGSMNSIFTEYGTYAAIQTVTNHTTGCVDTAKREFHISWIKPSFTLDQDSICQFSDAGFKDNSTTFSKHPLASWQYVSGDGGQVLGKNSTYTYKSGGKFVVKLIPINSVGCLDSISFYSITVLTLPKAVIVSDRKIGCIGTEINYANQSRIEGNGVPLKSFYWNFDYTKSKDSSFNISHSKSVKYKGVGKFYSYLKVKDFFGCTSFLDSTLIEITQPSSEYVYKPVVCNNEVFKTYCKNAAPGTKNSWLVDNVQIAIDQDTLSFSFQDKSDDIFVNHTISMASVDINGCPNKKENSISVSLPKSNISYSLKSQIENNLNDKGEFKCPPIESKYKDITASIGKIDSSYWSFGVGKKAVIHTPTINYLFPGIYSVTLRSKDEYGCFDDTTLLNFLTVLGPKAVSSWTSMGDICGQNYAFQLSKLENVSSIYWNMDDKTFVPDSLTLKHSYQNIQTFGPTVTLKDPEGCKVVYPLDSITIPDKGIKANYEISKKSIKIGEYTIFKDLSIPKNNLVLWKWNLFDGDTVITFKSENINHRYIQSGEKEIVLTIKDQNGCSDQEFQSLFVIDDYDVPNVITPNGDGVNDVLVFFDEIFSEFSVTIFNRWGNKVYTVKNQKGVFVWDGTDGNQNFLEDGVYFYTLDGTFLDGKFFAKKGNVTLL
jgi:gliding motility-associated-like protein